MATSVVLVIGPICSAKSRLGLICRLLGQWPAAKRGSAKVFGTEPNSSAALYRAMNRPGFRFYNLWGSQQLTANSLQQKPG